MHLRGNIGYHTWEEFWEKGYRSPYFKAEYDDTSERTDWAGYHGEAAFCLYAP